MRIFAVSFGCLIASLMVDPTSAQVLNLTRSAESGADSFIAWERGWDRNCNTLPVTVTITKNPVNGTLSVVPGVASTIPESTAGAGSVGACAGKPVTGNQVRYKSKLGFHGTDSGSYNVSNQPQRPRTITINVK